MIALKNDYKVNYPSSHFFLFNLKATTENLGTKRIVYIFEGPLHTNPDIFESATFSFWN